MDYIDLFVKYALQHKNIAVMDCFNTWVSCTGIVLSFEEAIEFIRVAENIMHAPQDLIAFYQ